LQRSQIIWRYRPVFLSLLAFLVVGAAGIAYVEELPFGDAIYFSLVTGLTIGYGDVVVKSFLGRSIALIIALNGIIFTGLVVAAAVHAVQITHQAD
jgi:uncharacterized membrane protein